jgi:hypothetical protein
VNIDLGIPLLTFSFPSFPLLLQVNCDRSPSIFQSEVDRSVDGLTAPDAMHLTSKF